MRRRTFPAVATSVILSTAAMMAIPAAAAVVGEPTSVNPQPHANASVQQVNWDGPYGYDHRPYAHDRFFFHHRFFHHRYHRFGW
jgi:hypothetical protein